MDEDEISDSSFHDVDAIENRQAVYNFFNTRELEYLGMNRNVYDLNNEMADYGYEGVFSYADLRMVLDVAQAESDKYFDTYGGIQY